MQRVAQLVFQTNVREFESLRRYHVPRANAERDYIYQMSRHVRLLVALDFSLPIENRREQIANIFGGIASIRITIARWPKQKHPTCLRQQWFIYAGLLGIERCPSTETVGGNDQTGVVERTLAHVPAREHR